MTTEIKTINGKTAIFFSKNGKTKDVVITDRELINLQEQITKHLSEKIMQELLKEDADSIILERDANFVTREIKPRVYKKVNDKVYEVKCETRTEYRIWIFDIDNDILTYNRYEGDFKG